jgi:hypothetical protein
MFKKILTFFSEPQVVEKPPEEKPRERLAKELLRENLMLVPLDMYYVDDPILEIAEDKRKKYLKKFANICGDRDVMERFNYLINKQVQITMNRALMGQSDVNGSFNINGIATVKDDFQRLANSYVKETVPEEDFNKYKII